MLFEDRARRKSLSYAEEREDRLGALYQIEAIGRIAREDNRPDSDGLFRMRKRLVSMILALDGRQTAFLSDILGERKLDFLMQELNRETNTIGSKANNARIARIVVNMKGELEKIREQVQNIE